MTEVTLQATTDPTHRARGVCEDHASLNRRVADDLGLGRNDHIRVENPPYAAYYRVTHRHEGEPAIMVHEDSLERFVGGHGETVTIHTTMPMEASIDEARSEGGLVETLRDDADGQDHLAILAPHGGAVEPGTREIAQQVYERFEERGTPVTLWTLAGYAAPGQSLDARRIWHVRGVHRAEEAYPLLHDHLIGRGFDVVVGIHRTPGLSEIAGRMDPDWRADIAGALAEETGETVVADTSLVSRPRTAGFYTENRLAYTNQAVHVDLAGPVCDDDHEAAARAIVDGLADHIEIERSKGHAGPPQTRDMPTREP